VGEIIVGHGTWAQSPAVGVSCARDTLPRNGWAREVDDCISQPISDLPLHFQGT